MFEYSNNFSINGGTFTEYHYAQSSEAIKQLLEASSPGALHNSGERFDPPKCHPNTRTAILQKLMDWFIGEFGWDNLVLWLYGPAGAGKSAIAQTFAELCAAKNILLASFFFSRSDSRRNNEKAFVATLAYQLWLNIRESRPIVEAVINNNPAIFQLNFETQFRTLFFNPLLQLSGDERFTSGTPLPNLIIIDGLDECKGVDVQNTILHTISNALQCHCSTHPFRFLFVSRPEHHLKTSFSVAPLNDLKFELILDGTEQAYEDIRLFLTDSFRDIRKTHIMHAHLPDSWPSDEDIAKLVAKSSGQFIYAATVIRYVSSPRHNPLDRLKVVQGLLPVNDDRPYAQLDALYINILSEVEDVKAVLKILGVAIILTDNEPYSIDPLGVYALEKFMQLTPGTVQLRLIDVLSVVDASDNNKPIKFLHASFIDFLVDPTRSCQFLIDPRKGHEEAAYFCISVIESLDTPTWLQTHAYRSLNSHLQLAGPLYDNTTLREKIFEVPYIQHWRPYAFVSRNKPLKYGTFLNGDPATFLEFLRTSKFRQTEELYLHHRGVLDQKLRDSLELMPMNPCLAFWTAVCAGGMFEYNPEVSLQTIRVLSSSSAPNVSAYVPGFLFSASFDQVEVDSDSERQEPALDNVYPITNIPYLRIVMEFLNDPLRAGPHVVDDLTYTTAAVFAVEFAVRSWDRTKSLSSDSYADDQWDFIWDSFAFVLSKAGYSAELVNSLNQQNLTFNLGRPGSNIRHRVQTLFRAVHNYLLKFSGSSPSIHPFKIKIMNPDKTFPRFVKCFTADDLDGPFFLITTSLWAKIERPCGDTKLSRTRIFG